MAYPLSLILSLMLSMSPESRIVKLPRACLPEHYELEIDLSNSDDVIPEVKGNVQIRINCLADTNNLTVNWKQLFIAENSVSITTFDDKKSKNLIKVSKINYQPDKDFIVFTFDQTLKKGSKYVLDINFANILELQSTALYKSSYYDSTKESIISTVLTNLYPMNARMIFPCFDEPDLKATFNLSLLYSPFYNAISNLVCVEDRCKKHSSETSACRKFSSQSPIAPHQLAFSIHNYDEMEESESYNPVIEGITDDHFEELAIAVNYSAFLMERFKDILGVEYPSEKLTLMTIDGNSWEFSGGNGLLGVPKVINDEEHLGIHLARGLIRHILSSRLTLNSWTELWLVEGLAWYIGYEVLADEYPEASARCWEVSRLDSTFTLQTNFSVVSLSLLNEIGLSAFCTFSDLATFIGKTSFIRGIKLLIDSSSKKEIDVETISNSFVNAFLQKRDLMEVLEKRSTNAEAPVLNVTRSGNSMAKYQLSIGSFNQSNTCQPLKVYFEKTSSLLNCSKLTIDFNTIPTNFSKLSQSKVLYDIPTYELIAKQLAGPNNVSTYDRIQLIQDALEFAWMGTVNYSIVLKLINYLRNETDYYSWQAALYHFDRIWNILEDDPRKDEYEMFLRMLVSPIYNKLKAWKEADKLSEKTRKLHSLLSIWTCRLNLDNCSNILRNIANDGNMPVYFVTALLREATTSTNRTVWNSAVEINKTNTKSQIEKLIIKSLEGAGSLIFNPILREIFGRISPSNDADFPSSSSNELIWFYITNDATNRNIIRLLAERIVSEDDYKMIRRVESSSSNDDIKSEVLNIIRSNLDWVKKRKEEFILSVSKFKP